ncbi:MAG: Crp/Fnr family transcriptional regulator [Bryobacteraceae bacterium]|nr:Crp/Fnr family transcriptional regulator [Bryobacteraceae bacterium]MDW8380204.1 Crp/Fnr family transcriptional regulator [Bryobacterales bacterium]
MTPIEHALGSIDLFAGLPSAEVQFLCSAAIPKHYEPGEFLFLEGEPCQGLWVVAGGVAKILKTTPSGRQIVLALQPAPATVAEVPVFDGGPYPASVCAVEPVEAILWLSRDFLAMCRRNPDVTLRFLAIFGARLRHLVGLVERITFGSVRQRLAQQLLVFADAAGSEKFVLPETHEEIANRLGTVREVVSRNLGRFQVEGMIRVRKREVEILSREALLSEASTEL